MWHLMLVRAAGAHDTGAMAQPTTSVRNDRPDQYRNRAREARAKAEASTDEEARQRFRNRIAVSDVFAFDSVRTMEIMKPDAVHPAEPALRILPFKGAAKFAPERLRRER